MNNYLDKNTYIPIGVALGVLVVAASWLISYGQFTSAIENTEARVETIEMANFPSREEFNQLRDTLNEVRTDVKILLKK